MFSVIQIAFMGICAVASVFLLTFLKALLRDSREHGRRHVRTETKSIFLSTPRREDKSATTRETVTTRAA
jgi:hypothetical protein